MRKIALALALSTMLLFIALPYSSLAPERGPEDPVPGFVFQEEGQVVRVKDGDTFVVRWEDYGYQDTVRTVGANAPELWNRQTQMRECFSVEATVWVANFLLNRWVWLSPSPDGRSRDQHGRVLGKVYLDSSRTAYLDRILVSQGFAEVQEVNGQVVDRTLIPLEEDARTARRGKWGSCPFDDP